MKKLLTLVSVAVFAIGCAATNISQPTASGELDFGDYTSETLTTRAWEAIDAGRYMDAVKYADKCAELYEEEAREMQEALKNDPARRASKSADEIHANWALNDVGTSYFIKGEALHKLGKNEEALGAYKAVITEFNYAQTWDPKGWFWSPAEAANKKLAMLSEDF